MGTVFLILWLLFLLAGFLLGSAILKYRREKMVQKYLDEMLDRNARDASLEEEYLELRSAIWRQIEDTNQARRAMAQMADAANKYRNSR